MLSWPSSPSVPQSTVEIARIMHVIRLLWISALRGTVKIENEIIQHKKGQAFQEGDLTRLLRQRGSTGMYIVIMPVVTLS